MKTKYLAPGLLAIGVLLAACSAPEAESEPVVTQTTTSEAETISLSDENLQRVKEACFDGAESPIDSRSEGSGSWTPYEFWEVDEVESSELETTYMVRASYDSQQQGAYNFSCTVDFNHDAELALLQQMNISTPPGVEPISDNIPALMESLNKIGTIYEAKNNNMIFRCLDAIEEDFPEVGRFNLLDDLEFEPSQKDSRVYRASGIIIPEDEFKVWWGSADFECTILTKNDYIQVWKADVTPRLNAPESEENQETNAPSAPPAQEQTPAVEEVPAQVEQAPVQEAPAPVEQPAAPVQQAPAEAPVRGFTGAPGSPIVDIDKTISHCGDPMMYETGTTFFTDGTTAWTETCSAQMLG
ncbi:hypothetical protein AALI21_02925 [Corynebacteriaceae bacterium 6-324]